MFDSVSKKIQTHCPVSKDFLVVYFTKGLNKHYITVTKWCWRINYEQYVIAQTKTPLKCHNQHERLIILFHMEWSLTRMCFILYDKKKLLQDPIIYLTVSKRLFKQLKFILFSYKGKSLQKSKTSNCEIIIILEDIQKSDPLPYHSPVLRLSSHVQSLPVT